MKAQGLPTFSRAEKKELLKSLREELPKTTRKVVDAFFESMGACIDRPPEEVELLQFNILYMLSRDAYSAKLTWGLVRSLEFYAEEMELNENVATGVELKALAHIMRERLNQQRRG